MQFPVEVMPVESRQVEYIINAVGSVEAFEEVQVTARVSGVVERVNFSEGDNVKEGTVFAEIEPERFRLSLQAAEASLKRAETAKAEAEAGLKRREEVNARNPGLIIGEEIENWRTRFRTASADLLEAKSRVDLAELNLRDALVRVPLSGTIQSRTVQTGQFVQPGTILATLIRREPLLLRFQIPEQDAANLRPGMKARFRIREAEDEFSAVITYVGESADLTSRMVSVTGRVSNSKRKILRPGAFAQVEIPIGEKVSSPVIPQTAVRPSERGFLAFVIENDIAKERIITLGMRTADGRVEVKSGLKSGENLVIRGAEALKDGSPVRQQPK